MKLILFELWSTKIVIPQNTQINMKLPRKKNLPNFKLKNKSNRSCHFELRQHLHKQIIISKILSILKVISPQSPKSKCLFETSVEFVGWINWIYVIMHYSISIPRYAFELFEHWKSQIGIELKFWWCALLFVVLFVCLFVWFQNLNLRKRGIKRSAFLRYSTFKGLPFTHLLHFQPSLTLLTFFFFLKKKLK